MSKEKSDYEFTEENTNCGFMAQENESKIVCSQPEKFQFSSNDANGCVFSANDEVTIRTARSRK